MILKTYSGLGKELKFRSESKMAATARAPDQEQMDKNYCKIPTKSRCAEHYHHIKSIDMSVKYYICLEEIIIICILLPDMQCDKDKNCGSLLIKFK